MRSRRRTNRLRIVLDAGVLFLLAGAPILLGATRPGSGAHADVPGMLDVYTSGFHSLGVASMVALPLAMLFALWLMAGERRLVNRKYLHGNARRPRQLRRLAPHARHPHRRGRPDRRQPHRPLRRSHRRPSGSRLRAAAPVLYVRTRARLPPSAEACSISPDASGR